MRILAIRGKNLASLAGEFGVDFAAEPLGRAGLFAITGATGAGKSTLLDALCLALYNATPRLLRAGGKGVAVPDGGEFKIGQNDPATLLRRGTGEGYAEVDFFANDQQCYRARWQVRRAFGKSTGRLQNSEIQLFSLSDGGHANNASNISGGSKTETLALIQRKVGLNFEQFTRAVLLAQNDFATFLKASDDDRADLLQTLTGTSSFSAISQQAYLRAKAEKENIDQLEKQLNHYVLLDTEALQTKHDELAALREQLRQQGQTLTQYQQWQQWQEQAADYAQKCAAANVAWQQAVRAEEAAAPRQAEFAKRTAIQAARPLWQAWQTRQTALSNAIAAFTVAQQQQHQAQTQQHAAKHALAVAEQQLHSAKTEWQTAAPSLAAAKALAVEIATWQTQVTAAEAEGQRLAQEIATAQAARQQAQTAHAHALHQHTEAATWLQENAALAALVTHASYVQQGLHNASTLRHKAAAATEASQHAAAELSRLHTNRETAFATQEHAATALAEQQTKLNELQIKLTQYDLQGIKSDLDQVQTDLQHCQQAMHLGVVWQEKAAAVTQAETVLAAIASDLATTTATLQQHEHALPLLAERLQQQTHALDRAKLRLSESAISLRQSLLPQQPCPVCGAEEHPYLQQNHANDDANDNAAVQAILAEMETERGRLATEWEHCLQIVHAERGKAENLRQQHTQQAAQLAQHQQLAHAAADAWQTAQQRLKKPLNEWQTELQTQERALQATQAAYQTTLAAREAALVARDTAQQADTAARQAYHALQQQVSQRQQEHDGQAQLAQESHAALAQQLTELAAVLTPIHPTWQEAWEADAVAFSTNCAAQIAQWQQQTTALATAKADCHQHEVTLASLHSSLAEKETNYQQYAANQSEMAAKLAELKAQAQGFFAGKAVEEVEAELRSAMETAEQQLNAARAQANQAQIAMTETTAAISFATQTHTRAMAELAQAETELKMWWQSTPYLLSPQIDQTGVDVSRDLTTLAHYFTYDPAALAAEEAALHALRQATSEARAVLLVLEEQEQAHRNNAPTTWTASELAAQHLALQTAQETTQAAITKVEIALADDQKQRDAHAHTAAAFAAQQTASQRWLRLGELIGSADGKKFRNFAQQLTLDLLLRHANLHLNDLARRYRLQRVEDSLGLLVVDQDMGDETRSVHSLSGGESFLVSLALALGLASLSAQQVRVESLFIDEGFGSLDAEALDIAMAALEKLQAQGRKVGIISHVREMTERIPTRIHIQRQAGGKSRVVVEGLDFANKV